MALRIFVVGHSCADALARLPRFPSSDEKLLATSIRLCGGGPAANAAVALSRLGHEVQLAAAFGDDEAGALQRQWLEAEGVGLEHSRTVAGASSSLAFLWASGEHRAVVWRRGNAPALTLQDDDLRTALRRADLLYLDGHELPLATRALELSARYGVPIVADLGTLRPGMQAWLPALAVAVAAPRFARALAGLKPGEHRPALELLDRLSSCVPAKSWSGITLGERGVLVRDGQGIPVVIPAREVQPVMDSTGAGDAFHAGLADGWLAGLGFGDACVWAAALAASVCRELGGRAGLPATREELDGLSRALPPGPATILATLRL